MSLVNTTLTARLEAPTISAETTRGASPRTLAFKPQPPLSCPELQTPPKENAPWSRGPRPATTLRPSMTSFPSTLPSTGTQFPLSILSPTTTSLKSSKSLFFVISPRGRKTAALVGPRVRDYNVSSLSRVTMLCPL